MARLSEELRGILDSGEFGLCLIGLVSQAEALEAERDALKADLAAILSENEALKILAKDIAHSKGLAGLDELEAARKQEPIGYTSQDSIDVVKIGLGLGSFVDEKLVEFPIPIYARPVPAQKAPWNPASVPPARAGDNLWSNPVVVVTNLDNVFRLQYFHGKEGGCWKRPSTFQPGEEVDCWIEMPVCQFNASKRYEE